LLVGAFLRFSRSGTALRAAGENSDRAAMLGISVGLLTTIVWGIVGALSGAAGMLGVTTGGFGPKEFLDPSLLLVPLPAAVVACPFFAPVRFQVLLSDVFITAIAALSLVVLTGWAGQVSLGQYAFVAVGAVATGALARHGVPIWFCIPVAIAATGLVAGAVG